ncbi:TfoX/Sxy family protein [Niveibacterium sp. 24ML]|uniref:TfoX/Sxy family protein n=1 Tax=Niveibacterium sp. 24ML TaxID=2985512 RepID=UPI00226E5FF0|nr:TfoX/Sxy family protein [Niveibacterium sp. 24ML]MCX9158009.1 TfoX/Sxy family protein [Niveibacterium sp. 24ML]
MARSDELRGLRNLGPRSQQMLATVGIHSAAELAARGAVRAWLDLRRQGCKVSLNLLWALVGALDGRDWREVARTDRLDLLMQIEALEASRQLGLD